ncbi:UTP--glucose-1-phosphate uridylyltransferase [Aeromicrobium sp. Leaf350]|uniref:UTP--glucose-1-phosphate uridylyltransferase n=1 Tax=Aeromicrobium sp. Leaf350 TaxID=2876565 RepID=UPI001E3DB3DC|nr:UTP--glucose-1-phosphate uridylyltransferase [Aeromicrobium sp. Leaf350]
MSDAGVPQQAIDVFTHYYDQLQAGATGMIPEADVEPLTGIERAATLEVDPEAVRTAADATVVIKLNGGLGTSMGMDRAKSLLPVRRGMTFLDIIVGQVEHVRKAYDVRLPLIFMNSFRTRDDTRAALAGHPGIEVPGLPMDFVQNLEPRLRADDLTPVDWPADPELEWCPPGHGDLYTALQTSGILDQLLDAGYLYATVSNSDNLGAAPDPEMMAWFARSGAPYAAEVCRRTPADVKGGHLVVRRSDGRLVLRETAQTPSEDADQASDLTRHRYFHTNNLWFDLRVLKKTLDERQGILGLPLIRNRKVVDPADPTSPEVIQIETAMGAAVQVFDGATAIEVDRARFLPVKTTNDLLLLRSDVYGVGDDFRVRATTSPPLVDLDKRYFGTIADFEARFPHVPSLASAERFTVRGDWSFGADVVVAGEVVLEDDETTAKTGDAPGRAARVAEGTRLG